MNLVDIIKAGIAQFNEGNIDTAKSTFEQVPENEYTNFMLAKCYERGGVSFQKDLAKAYKLMRKAADAGYNAAQLRFALYYINGYGCSKDPKQSFNWIKKAAENEEDEAKRLLGIYYREGIGCNVNYQKAEEIFLECIASEDFAAEYELGNLYMCEKYRKTNDEILTLWRKAAEHNVVDAQIRLGDCYRSGELVQQDYAKALEWYTAATKSDSGEAYYRLASLYYLGNGVEQDFEKAGEYFLKSANLGYANSMYQVGLMYKNGRGFEQDYNQAFEWLSKAAEENNAEAICEIATLYQLGEGVEADYKKAKEYYQLAIDLGSVEAIYGMGVLYYQGYGVEQNYEEAYSWFLKSADQGFDMAQYFVAKCLSDGKGVSQDYKKAFEWFEKAAEQGHIGAIYYLGRCYKKGLGIRQDYTKAFEWYKKAADMGDDDAQCCLGICYENGEGVEQNYEQAFYWYQKSAEQGDEDAAFYLGRCFEKGFGTNVNVDVAIEWYQKSASKGSEDAKGALLKLGAAYETTEQASVSSSNFEHDPENFKQFVLEDATYSYSSMYNGQPRSPYTNAPESIYNLDEYCTRASAYKKRLEQERIEFGKSIKTVKKNKKANEEKALAKKTKRKKIRKIIVRLIILAIIVAIGYMAYQYISTSGEIGPNVSVNAEHYEVWDGSVATEFANGTGTKRDPYQISTGAELAYFASVINEADENYKSAYYCMVNSIDLNGMEWTQIGYSSYGSQSGINKKFSGVHSFNGVFDGKNCVIKNYSITSSKKQMVGFFGDLNGGTIQNLGLEDFTISATNDTTQEYYVGGIVAYNRNGGKVLNCYIEGDVAFVATSDDVYVGGIVGVNATDSVIENCYSTGNISAIYRAKSYYGYSNTKEACAGGIVCLNSGNITNCYATGNVSAYTNDGTYIRAGGIAATNSSVGSSNTAYKHGKISNCYATGNVSAIGEAEAYAGGLIACHWSGATVDNCFATGDVKAEGSSKRYASAGGLIGIARETSDVVNSYRLNEQNISVSGADEYNENICTDGTGISMEELTSKSFQTDTLKYADHWVIVEGGFPTIEPFLQKSDSKIDMESVIKDLENLFSKSKN